MENTILYCDTCGWALKWRCPHCGSKSYRATTRGFELGAAGSFALGFLGPLDWRTQVLAAKGLERANERAVLCNLCGRTYGANPGLTVEQAFQCREPGCDGHYTDEAPGP